MRYVTWCFVAVYLVLTALYLRKPKPAQEHGRVFNKTALAVLYFLHAVFALFAVRHFDAPELLAILAALSLCMAGDIVIQYRFVTGAVLFFAANLVFFSYQIWSLHELGLKLKNVIWFIPVSAALVALAAWLEKIKWLKLGRLISAAILYLASVTFSGTLALAVAFSGRGGPGTRLLGAGLALFMISDYFLIYREFRKKSRLAGACNTVSYFIGMMLVSLSVLWL